MIFFNKWKQFFPYKACLIVLLLMSTLAKAQTNLESLVSAERSFAKYAKDHSTQEAFVNFLSSDGIVFEKGKPVNALEAWKARKPDSALLSWYPVFADVAASGDLGYTTGPYDYRRKKDDKDPIAFGQFNTVWKKQADGQWKALVDFGVHHKKPIIKEELHFASINQPIGNKSNLGELTAVENDFIKSENAGGPSTYQTYLSSTARVYRPGEFPLITPNDIANEVINKKYIYDLINIGISSSGDLGYSYGTATFTVGEKEINGNYLRVWKLEGGHWKIVLDVING